MRKPLPSAPKPSPFPGFSSHTSIPTGAPFSKIPSSKNQLCYRCGKPGHMRAYCRAQINEIHPERLAVLVEQACDFNDIPIGPDSSQEDQSQEEDTTTYEQNEYDEQGYEYDQDTEEQPLIDFDDLNSQTQEN